MKTNGNDPANPIKDVGFDAEKGNISFDVNSYDFKVNLAGLTKREYFAAMAMHSMLPATFRQNGFQRGTADGLADYAVKVADALIKSLNN